MKMITHVFKLMMIILLSSSIFVVQAQKAKTPTTKAEKVALQKAQYTGNSVEGVLKLDKMIKKAQPQQKAQKVAKMVNLKNQNPVSMSTKPVNFYKPADNSKVAPLYSQMTPGDFNGASQDFVDPVNDPYDCQGADDFTVPTGETWDILVIRFYGSWSAAGPADGFNIFFYDDNAGVPGTELASFPLVPYTDAGGLFQVEIPGGPYSLTEGTYWISIQCRMEYAVGGQWYWAANAAPQTAAEAVWQNPGGGFGGCTSWCGLSVQWPDYTSRDFTFELWDVIPPIAIVPAPWCQSDDNSFDAGGNVMYEIYLQAGQTYNFSLCANDGCCAGDYTTAGLGDGDLTMFDATNTQLWYIDGLSSCGYNASTYGSSYENWSPPADGYYYLMVDDYNDDGGVYTLSYSSAGAMPLTVNETCTTETGTIPAGDYIVYQIDMNTSSAYNFSLCNLDPTCAGDYLTAGTGDGDLYLFDNHGNTIFYIDGASTCGYNASTWGTAYQDFTPAYNGCHFLVVADFANSGGDYTLGHIRSTCLPPTGLLTSNINYTSARLEWTPGATESEWIIEWGEEPFTPGSGPNSVDYVCSDPCNYYYDISSLTEGTHYQWSIRSVCSGSSQSGWQTAFFSTPCDLVCPSGGIDEGEADIADDGEDITNGGCNAATPIFSPISVGDTYCGKVNTYLYFGSQYRDTDWYRLDLTGTNAVWDLTWSVEAEFPLLLFIIDSNGEDCPNAITLNSGTADACTPLSISALGLYPGVYYLWVGPSVFTGLESATGPHKYIATITGTSTPLYTISGNLTYGNGAMTPMDNTAVNLNDNTKALLETTTTDDFGYFEFMVLSGDYNLTAATTKPRGGTEIGDVNLVINHILGSPLTGLPFMAADVTNNDVVDVQDLNGLVNDILGSPGWAAPDWRFDNPAFSVVSSDVVEDFQALCSGDPNGTYTPPYGSFTNDNCADAFTISCGDDVFGETNTATIDGPATTCTAGSVGPDVWYVFAGTGDNITASLCGGGTDYDSKIDIYEGNCGALVSVDCNDDYCSLASQITWSSVAGTDYYIRVHGFSGATGNYQLTVTCAPAPLYCDASTSTPCDESIGNVLCGTINNTTGCQGGVDDWTSLSTSIAAGGSEPITVTNGGNFYASDMVTCWVDWDGSLSWEQGGNEEFILTNDGTGYQFTGSIVAPAGTPSGTYRMRVRMSYSTAPVPCGNMSYGEIEDYSIVVP